MERIVHAVSAVCGAIIGFMFGEVTGLIVTLIFFRAIDYVTGKKKKILKERKNHEKYRRRSA